MTGGKFQNGNVCNFTSRSASGRHYDKLFRPFQRNFPVIQVKHGCICFQRKKFCYINNRSATNGNNSFIRNVLCILINFFYKNVRRLATSIIISENNVRAVYKTVKIFPGRTSDKNKIVRAYTECLAEFLCRIAKIDVRYYPELFHIHHHKNLCSTGLQR